MPFYPLMKRTIDLLAALFLLLLALPVALPLALAIRLESAGGVFFAQKRIGRGGIAFTMRKFRSMVSDAATQGPYWTANNDPRITRMGALIRRTSLDELPQLWNVLMGDMSLIGPRPETALQESQYTAQDWKLRHRVRPGITGLAQVNGRSAITAEDRLRFDLQYAEQYSLGMDARIVLKTIQQVLCKVGVN